MEFPRNFDRASSARALLLLALPVLTTGCGTLGYLFQAGHGQLALINHARPITEVLKDERTPPRLRGLLAEIPSIKTFGEEKGLKATSNYSDYVGLDRPAAVWVVSAAETLRFKSKEWSFPIIGRVPYLGWFRLESAKDFASELEREGWDVDVRGAGAYSTLGWFQDPVLSSMIPPGEEAQGELVNIVLHESVHATFYVNGQTAFNESLASFVADRLTDEFLAAKYGKASGVSLAYYQSVQARSARDKLFRKAFDDLNALYESNRSEDEKLASKIRLLSALKTALNTRRELNNASLIQYKAYNSAEAEFLELYSRCGSDWKRFWEAIRALNEKSFPEPQYPAFGRVILESAGNCAAK